MKSRFHVSGIWKMVRPLMNINNEIWFKSEDVSFVEKRSDGTLTLYLVPAGLQYTFKYRRRKDEPGYNNLVKYLEAKSKEY